MRDKDASITSVNTSFIHKSQDRFGTGFWLHGSFKSWRVLFKLLKQSHSLLTLFFSFYKNVSEESAFSVIKMTAYQSEDYLCLLLQGI